jgi:hypothetical protein
LDGVLLVDVAEDEVRDVVGSGEDVAEVDRLCFRVSRACVFTCPRRGGLAPGRLSLEPEQGLHKYLDWIAAPADEMLGECWLRATGVSLFALHGEPGHFEALDETRRFRTTSAMLVE